MNPTPQQISAHRNKVGLTQTKAAELIHSNLRTWQDWEGGKYRMHPGLWELFLLKTATNPTNNENLYVDLHQIRFLQHS